MNRYLSSLTNDRGSALIVMVVLIPVLTLFCILAANVSFQNLTVTASDKCHRDGLYNADGAVYGTAALISKICKSDDPPRAPVQSGTGNAAPGIEYLSGDTSADYFASLVSNADSKDTTEDIKFLKPDDTEDIGIEATVDMEKFRSDSPTGGGAEFATAAEGIGTQINVVVFRLRAKGRSACANTSVQVNGDYWMIVTKGGQTKGI